MREYYLCIFRLFQSSFPYLILQSLIFLFPFFLSNFPLNAHICLSFTKNNPSASWLSSYLRSLHSLSPLPYQGSCTALSVQCALCTASRTRRTGSSPSPSTRTAVLVLLPLLCWLSVPRQPLLHQEDQDIKLNTAATIPPLPFLLYASLNLQTFACSRLVLSLIFSASLVAERE